MPVKQKIHYWEDWSPVPSDIPEDYHDILLNNRILGVHEYQGALWTGGYVGVMAHESQVSAALGATSTRHVTVIQPRFKFDPWEMLRAVLLDDEYSSYVSEIERNQNEFLYKLFFDRPLLRMPISVESKADLLYAVCFVDSCYKVCKKGIKLTVGKHEENCAAKIKGRIDAKRNIRENTARGRNERFCCVYRKPEIDNIENRILKAALKRAKKMLGPDLASTAEMQRRLHFCETRLRGVKEVKITLRDFAKVSTTGLYSFYRPAIQQARCILQRDNRTSGLERSGAAVGSTYTTQYLINMEKLFELYARSMLKKAIRGIGDRYELSAYSAKWYFQKGEDAERATNTHLIQYCIPDLVIEDKDEGRSVIVLDAKYKRHDRPSRSDTHQLLAYLAVTGAAVCGFVMPGEFSQLKELTPTDTYTIALNAPFSVNELQYCELLTDGTSCDSAVMELLDCIDASCYGMDFDAADTEEEIDVVE